jgi:vancomycin permeability regulator SanA
MGSRLVHRMTLFRDRDVLHAGTVAVLACMASAGLVYLGYLVHVWRVARNAPCEAGRGDCLLLFGKHAPRGEPDRDFARRLDRAVALCRVRKPRQMVLLGGGPPGVPSEAEIARLGLFERGLAEESPWLLEAQSRDTLQNLRNARDLLARLDDRGRVTLLSSRYHLARCALFARQLGLDAELVAAEAKLKLDPRMLLRLAGEAGYVCLTDIGTRWVRLIGARRALERVT